MSERTALYRLFDINDTLLYIGVARIFGIRWHQHAGTQSWWPDVHHQTIEWHESRPDAEKAETAAIKVEHPVHNFIHNRRRRVRVMTDSGSGFPADDHPRLAAIREARAEYDVAREQFFQEIRDALADADALPEDQKRKLGPSAIGRAASFTREYISKIRDGKAD